MFVMVQALLRPVWPAQGVVGRGAGEWWPEAVSWGVLCGFHSTCNRKPWEGCELRMARCDLI